MSRSQNLVPNPSFETYTLCPNNTGGGQIEVAMPWTAAVSISSTDYFNSCSSIMNVPNYNGGFQYAKTGNAYAGLFFYRGSNREYLQVQLSNPLINNKTYFVEFYINMNDFYSSPCNNIAANLSIARPFTLNTDELQSLTPHIMLLGNPVISDTANWVQVSGCYTAQGGEEYLTIGNFFDNANTVVTGTTGISYYFVDDVRVEEIPGVCVVGVNDLSDNRYIKVYPNPTTGKLKVIMSHPELVSWSHEMLKQVQHDTCIKITDIVGREVKQFEYSEELDISFLEKGIYFVSVEQEGKTLVTRKIIKE